MRPHELDPLFLSVKVLPGIGPRLGKLFEKLTGPRVLDVLFHLPVSLIDRRFAPKIAEAPDGRIATITMTIEKHIPSPSRSQPYRVRGMDETGVIDLIFFHVKGDYLEHQLPVGQKRVVSGKIEHYHGIPQMPHPDAIGTEAERAKIETVEPVYPMTAGLTPKPIAKAIRGALERVPATLPEWIDHNLIKQRNWPSWVEALKSVHAPTDESALDPQSPARQRLAYDEMLANQLAMALLRNYHRKQKGRILAGNTELETKALSILPYQLTNTQKEAIEDIRKDMAAETRMLRLLQGDVGSGKTIVAFFAMLTAIGSGAQGCIMAPTEILARQHEINMTLLAEKLGLKVATLTGRDKGKARDAILQDIADGTVHIVIGTHALFQKDVAFKDLGLVVIDEQHRFGVHQRLELSAKGQEADMLVMTATPIPRTLTLTAYGDMDVSRLTEKPPGRLPIDTRLASLDRIGEVVDGLKRKVAEGSRVYWVCPLVEESEKLDLAAAEERFIHMEQEFPGRAGLLHGRMKPADKDAVMEKFKAGDLDILVSTTVIEVGVDVPEATVMVIEHAERFGLSQLHQLRGRIGRGSGKSTCILLFNPRIGPIAQSRLKTIRETEDGFLIAEEDLRLRGAGEVLGTKQSGLPEFKLASLEFHASLAKIAWDDARLMIEKDPGFNTERGHAMRALLYLFGKDDATRYLRSG